MNIPKYAMTHKTVIHFLLIGILVAGYIAYGSIGRLEDAPFVIKQARITVLYPGASAQEVEELVTDPIEETLQRVPSYNFVRSESRPGIAIIDFVLENFTDPNDVPQIWDQMRNKLSDLAPNLPSGVRMSINDDFGDVSGYYFSLVAEDGYTYKEMEEYADFLKKELITAADVSRIDFYGVQTQVVNIEISNDKLANSGIIPNQVIQVLNTQNNLVNAGKIFPGNNEVRINAEGTFQSIEEIEELLIPNANGKQFRLKEIADVSLDYREPATVKMRVNGKNAIGIGISTRKGGNAILLGNDVTERLEKLKYRLPAGMDIVGLYYQDRIAAEANNDFILNLVISIAIVVLLILLAMGYRAGILIGTGLLFAIVGTFVFMLPLGIEFHRTSLASFIIAMGMLVDNAIVVTDNAQINMKKGMSKTDALIKGGAVPQWGLLGATIIAIISFMPLYVAKAGAAEIMAPLFIVIGVSLFLSWIFALIQTPVYGGMILKEPKGEQGDPYDTKFYTKLESIIEWTINKKWLMLGVGVFLFFSSVAIFKTVKRDFIAPVEKPVFRMDYLLPQGTSIYTLEEKVKEVENFLEQREDLKTVSVTLGSSSLRYYLASKSFSVRPNFANFSIELESSENVDQAMEELKHFVLNNQPSATPLLSKFIVAAQPEAVVEAMFQGPDADTLRHLTQQAMDIMQQNPKAEFVRSSWGNKVPRWSPNYSQTKGQQALITRETMAKSLRRLTDGQAVGSFRQDNDVLPILVKDANKDNYDFSNLGSFSMLNNKGETILLDQVVDGYSLEHEEWVIRRYNRQRAMVAQCETAPGIKNPELEAELVPLIEAIPLPEGYTLMWDGMKYKQNESVSAILAPFPLAMVMMIAILIFLFNSFKKTIVIFSMVPLLLFGVAVALKLSGMYFSFFAILGVLGLIGMVIKNGIVLIEQADIEIDENGKTKYEAIVFAAKARAVPVAMAAGTTIMGMIPLIPDAMFGGLAVTIMGGLFGSTLLTIFLIPPFYALLYKITAKKQN